VAKRGPVFSTNPQWKRPLRGEVMVDEATKRRIARRRRHRLAFVCGMVCFVAALVGLYFSPAVRVNNVNVTGTTALSPADVESIAGIEGESMFTLDFAEAQRHIEALPNVASVSFERHFPQTIEIKITERAPWGVWSVKGTPYVIDVEGVVLAAPVQEGALTISAVSSVDPLVPGDRVDRDAIQLTQELLNQVPSRLALGIAAVEWSNASGLTVQTDAGYRVVVGDSENVEYKLAVWSQIEAELGREAMGGHVLDLRFSDRPSLQ